MDSQKLVEDLLQQLHAGGADQQLRRAISRYVQDEIDRAIQRWQEEANRYRLLAQLGQIVNSTLDVQKFFYRAATQIHQLLACERISLILTDCEEWIGFALTFDDTPVWENLSTDNLKDSPAHAVAQRREMRIIDDLSTEHPVPEDQRRREEGFLSSLYLPLICRDEVLGVLGLAWRKTGGVPQSDVSLQEELGPVLATALDNVRAYGQIRDLKKRLEKENLFLRDEIKTIQQPLELIGASPALEKVRRAIEQVAPTDSTVLITGETGTGKELVARAIHERSKRARRLLIRVNCAALAQSVINSELFGHEAGAFTGATRRRQGRFELADQGTLFLDEIAETPAETQVLLLRVLQERVIERVGGTEPIPVDVRIIAATNRDLAGAVAEGQFRSDLYYRLHVFPIHVPPLRERPEDIPILADHFLKHFSRMMHKPMERISPETIKLLAQYHWPGNVRELEHLIERAVIVQEGPVLTVDPSWLAPNIATPASTTARQPLADMERQKIVEALNACGGKIYGPTGAAKLLGVKPTTLYGKMRKYNIKRKAQSRLFE